MPPLDAPEAPCLTRRNDQPNLFLALVYKAAGVPIAAGVLDPFTGLLLSPVICGGRDELRRRVDECQRPAAPVGDATNHLWRRGSLPGHAWPGVGTGERYTRSVTLFPQRTIGAFLIAVLAAVPVSGPLCSALCALAALSETAADHGGHGDASACHDLIGDGAVVSGASGHDCTRHHGLAGDSLASVSATRADVGLIGLVQHLAPSVPHGMLGLVALNMRSRPGAPNASPPPIRTPLVLRI